MSLACELRGVLQQIEREAAARQHVPCPRAIGFARRDTAQDDVDPRHQFARAERFCHIVVAADFQAQHAIDLLVARRQEQDRHVGGLADLAADFEPVQFRHADVEHDQFRAVAGKARQRFLAVARLPRNHAGLAQRDADHLADVLIVVDDKDAVRQPLSPLGATGHDCTGDAPPAATYRLSR